MKKITILTFLFALLVTSVGISQTNVAELGANPDVEIFGNGVTQNFVFAPCSYNQPTAGTPNGYSISAGGPFMVADDFDVAAVETFTAETFTAPILLPTGVSLVSADIGMWDDAGGVPGTALFSLPAQAPVTQTVVGSAFGLDIVECVFDVTGMGLAVDGGPLGATYWISLGLGEASDGGNQFWEATDTVTGNESAFENAGGGWMPGTVTFGSPRDMVLLLTGDCSPTLGVGDNLADLVNIYPNPATTRINLDVPANIEILDVALYDVLGKNTGAVLVNGSIDVSNLSRGVYILNVNSTSGTLTQKVIKR